MDATGDKDQDIVSITGYEDIQSGTLPKHVQDLMFGLKGRRELKEKDFTSYGCLGVGEVTEAMEQPLKHPFWLPEYQKKLPSIHLERRQKDHLIRKERSGISSDTKRAQNKYAKYDKMLQRNEYGKIAFINDHIMRDVLPQWCQDRLRTACRSARFELPLDKSILENITPLQFLAKYTRLYNEQRRRYSRIFHKHKPKSTDCIDYENLFPALNSMFGTFLSAENFDILCTALFIDNHTVLDETTFIGVCTFADRLFWTSYLDYLDRDTFKFLGPNRSVLEYVDFDSLQRKLQTVTLSKEIHHLLYSLA